MYTLAYESKSIRNPTDPEMEELLALARARNSLEGITGCLIYHMGSFIQVLEGKKDNVLRLFKMIKVDARHCEVHLFSDDVIDERNFPDWDMGYYGYVNNSPDTKELERFKKNLSLFADLSASNNITAKLFWRRVKLLVTGPPKAF